jgi:hypothetical protein
MTNEEAEIAIRNLKKRGQISSRYFIAVFFIGLISAGFVKNSGGDNAIWMGIFIITGIFVILLKIEGIESKLEFYEERYYKGLIKEIDQTDWNRDFEAKIKKWDAELEESRKVPDDQ